MGFKVIRRSGSKGKTPTCTLVSYLAHLNWALHSWRVENAYKASSLNGF